jgi:hypothetical protein
VQKVRVLRQEATRLPIPKAFLLPSAQTVSFRKQPQERELPPPELAQQVLSQQVLSRLIFWLSSPLPLRNHFALFHNLRVRGNHNKNYQEMSRH